MIQMADEAKRANMAKTDFLRRMSHDMRTPINAINGYVRIAGAFPDDQVKQQECRNKILTASGYLLEMIKSVLDMSKLESGEMQLEEVPFDLNELLHDVGVLLSTQAQARGITYTVTMEDKGEKHVIGSPLHLRQVFQNIGGNAILIFGFGMGVMGAALASLISRAVACCAVLFLLQKPDCMLRITGLSALRPDGGLIRRILRVGIPAGIENGMFQIGKLSVASLTSTLGTAAIAANAVANTTSTFLNIPANAVSMAVLTVVGQCLGAGEKEQAVWYARRLLLVAYCGAWVMNLSGFFFADRWALSWFNLSPEASAMALEVMMWFNIVSLFFWPSSFTLPNILRSAGDASFTMAVSIVSMWVFRVGFCYLWVLRMGGGLLSIWMGMYLDWVFRSLCFAVRFVRGRWLEKTVI